MRLLRNFDSATEYFDLDSNSTIKHSYQERIVGWYAYINSEICALFVENKNIYILYCEHREVINDSHHIKIIYGINGPNQLFLYKNENIIFSFFYDKNIINNIQPFDYLDDNDFDWGLFLENIINNSNVREDFIANMS